MVSLIPSSPKGVGVAKSGVLFQERKPMVVDQYLHFKRVLSPNAGSYSSQQPSVTFRITGATVTCIKKYVRFGDCSQYTGDG
jgi:hypothetical protein